MQTSNLVKGQEFKLGTKQFSKKEVIDFALLFDPLDVHINEEKAKKSIFKGWVCSGSQAFNYFYATHWIPLFGHSVVAGLSVNNWLFKLPIYAEDKITCSCKIDEISMLSDENKMVITWFFEIFNSKGELAQSLELKILHRKN